MSKLFLSSSFFDTAELFQDFAGDNLRGKSVTFIPTASLVEEIVFYIDEDKNALKKLGLTVDELEISNAPFEEISKKIIGNDYIFVSGGNTFYLLQELKKSGADEIIIQEIRKGKIYIGSSAGSVVLSKDIDYIKSMDNAKKAEHLSDYSGLNMIDFYPLPHYNSFPFEEIAENIIQEYQNILALKPITNKQVITVTDTNTKIIDCFSNEE